MEGGVAKSIYASLGLIVLIVAISGCRTLNDHNPLAEIASFEAVVIDDFEGPGTAGFEFSESIARSIQSSGLFSQILREKAQGEALRIRGTITRYSRGNPAMRLRYGHNIGNARFSVAVRLEDYATGDFVASFSLNETYDTAKDRERVNQNLDTLIERTAVRLAEKLTELANGD